MSDLCRFLTVFLQVFLFPGLNPEIFGFENFEFERLTRSAVDYSTIDLLEIGMNISAERPCGK